MFVKIAYDLYSAKQIPQFHKSLSDICSYLMQCNECDLIISDLSIDILLNFVKIKNRQFFPMMYQIFHVLTRSDSVCFQILLNGGEIIFFQNYNKNLFDQSSEQYLALCCCHLIDVILSKAPPGEITLFNNNFPLIYFTESTSSIKNKFQFMVFFAKHCFLNQDSYTISQILRQNYINDAKIKISTAWVLYYIVKNNEENVIHFMEIYNFLANQLDPNDFDFMKPFLQFCILVLERTSNEDVVSNILNKMNQLSLMKVLMSSENIIVNHHILELLGFIYQHNRLELFFFSFQTINNFINIVLNGNFILKRKTISLVSCLVPNFQLDIIMSLIGNCDFFHCLLDVIEAEGDCRPTVNILFSIVDILKKNNQDIMCNNFLLMVRDFHFIEALQNAYQSFDLQDENLLLQIKTLENEFQHL